jgi:cytidylate kinase
MAAALLLLGAPGSGKSSVLDALSTLLEIDGVEHGAIETEELSRGWPPLPATRWVPQLAAALEIQREAGRRLFLIAATTESDDELGELIAAAAAEPSLVVCLSASADVLARRLQSREPDLWPGKRALIEHARLLATTIPALEGLDLTIETDQRQAQEVAAIVRDEMRARELLDA